MLRVEEFRRGKISLPSSEADEVPALCFSCVFLAYKEFSMSEDQGLFYFYCAFEGEPGSCGPPPCLEGKSHR